MGVGEVERGVQHEVGLDDPASLLADVVEEPGALQRDAALVAILGKEKGRERVSAVCQLGGRAWKRRRRKLYLEGFEDSGSFKSLIRGVGGGFAPVTISSQHDPLKDTNTGER